jgi:hypothetical protein
MTSAPASHPAPPPASASLVWVAAVGSLLLVLGLLLSGRGDLARLAIPAGAVAVGLALYFRRPIGYLHFTLWTWFLIPLVRRLVDWRFGFQDHNLILAAPFLVSGIAGITLLRERRIADPVPLTSFFLCLAGVAYGLAVGLIRWRLHDADASTPGEIAFGFFDWVAPLLLGLHICIRWSMYEEHKKAVEQSFLWATLLLGLYGIYQFIAAPPWDCAWLEGLPLGFENASFGHPAPFEIRVWSTLNSPGLFAIVMLAALILLFGTKTRYKAIFAAAGYISLLLSMVRTAWLAWLLAMVLLLSNYRGATLLRFLFALTLLPLCLLPIVFSPEIAQTVQDRLATMQSVQQDGSFQERSAMYEDVTAALIRNPAGIGLRNNSFTVDGFVLDSGFLQATAMLGFTGTILYASGILFGIRSMIVAKSTGLLRSLGQQESAFRVVALVCIAEVVAGNMFINVGGVILWIFLGLWMSARASVGVDDRLLMRSNDPLPHATSAISGEVLT